MNKLRQHAITAFLILCPLWYYPNFSRESQENFFRYACLILFSLFVGNVWLGAFMALNVISFLYNGAEVGLGQVMNVSFGCLLFAFSRYFFKKNEFSLVYKPIMIVTSVTLVFMALQLMRLDPIFSPQTNSGVVMAGPMNDPVGFFGLKEANGTFLTLAMPIVASLNPIIALLLLIPIKMSASSSVSLASAVVILFYAFYMHKKFFRICLLIIPIAILFILKDLYTDPKTFTARFPVWHSAISYTLKGHGIGYGPDSYRNYNKHKNFRFVGDDFYNHAILKKDGDSEIFRYYSPSNDSSKVEKLMSNIHNTCIVKESRMDEWDNPHSMPINIFFQYGFIGIFLFGGLLFEMYKRFKYAMKSKELVVITSCLLVYLLTGLTHFPLEIARTAFFAPILLGAFYARTDEIC